MPGQGKGRDRTGIRSATDQDHDHLHTRTPRSSQGPLKPPTHTSSYLQLAHLEVVAVEAGGPQHEEHGAEEHRVVHRNGQVDVADMARARIVREGARCAPADTDEGSEGQGEREIRERPQRPGGGGLERETLERDAVEGDTVARDTVEKDLVERDPMESDPVERDLVKSWSQLLVSLSSFLSRLSMPLF